MGLFSERKPYTAISSETEYLLSRGSSADPAKLLNLIELIQGSNPTEPGGQEAGRLLRKSIKHGTPSEQIRALSLLETLVDNGVKTGPLVIHSGLSEQLTQLAASHVSHMKGDMSKSAKATRQCRTLLLEWSSRKDRNIASLYKSAGLADKHEKRRTRNSFHPDDDLDREVFGQSSSSGSSNGRHSRHHSRSLSANRNSDFSPNTPHSPAASRPGGSRSRSPSPINLRGSSIETTIATAHNVATRLTNALIASPKGSRDTETYYRQAKQVRHLIIKFVHDPSSEVQTYIGQLLAANEELIAALQAHDAVIDNGETLTSRDDHDLLDLGSSSGGSGGNGGAPFIEPVRPPPSPSRESISSGGSNSEPESEIGSKHPSGGDPFDPFADDNEQLERPKHTPLW